MFNLLTNRTRQFFIITLLAMLTSACGFHLRGDYLLPEQVSELSLTSFDDFSEITRNVRQELRMNGISVVAPSSSIPNLHLVSESDSNRTLSIYQNSRAAEYEITYTVRYRILVPGFDNKQFSTSVNRSYLDNPLAALAKSVEKDMMLKEMRQQAAQQILRQMARLKAETVVQREQNDDYAQSPTQTSDASDGSIEVELSATPTTTNNEQ